MSKVHKGKRSARRRVSAQQVRDNAKRGANTQQWFKLPSGVREWSPDEPGKYDINLLPYEVQDKAHPDGVEPGNLWYKRPFGVHRNVGPDNRKVVCPASLGLRCPICEARARLAKQDWQGNKDRIAELSPQKWVALPMIDPDDPDAIAILVMSRGKFVSPLGEELEAAEDSDLLFWDVNKNGRTLRVRFIKKNFEGTDFLQAKRFDFIPREAMDEDEVLGKMPCLDNIFNVMGYDALKDLFLQIDEEDDDDEKPKGKKSQKSTAKEDDEDDEDDDEEESEDETDDDEEEDESEDDDDDEEDDDEEEESEDDDEEDDDEKPKGKKADDKVKGKGKKKPEPEDDDDDEEESEDDDDDDEEDEGDNDEEEKPKGKKKSKADEEDDEDESEDDDDDDDESDEDEDDDDDDEDEEEKPKGKKSSGKKPVKDKEEKAEKPKGKKGKCPHGHKFGKDCDNFKDCGDCEVWKECDAANNK